MIGVLEPGKGVGQSRYKGRGIVHMGASLVFWSVRWLRPVTFVVVRSVHMYDHCFCVI